MTQREPQNDDFMTVDAAKRRLHLREVGGSPAGRYDGIGSDLRAARMRSRLDLDAIGLKLRISPAYLLAIEEGRFGDLPGHVYVYGFLRTYAQHLGLDAENVIRQYKTEAANPKPKAKLDFPSPMDRGRLPTLRLLVMSVALAGFVYAGWSYLTRDNRQTAERVAALPQRFVTPEMAPAATPVAPEPAVRPAEPARGETAAASVPVTPAPAEPTAAPVPVVVAPASAPPAPVVTPPAPPAAMAPAPPPVAAPPAAPPPAAATAPAPAPAAAAPAATVSAAPAVIGEDPRRRAGEAAPSAATPSPATAPAGRTDTAALPGQESVAAIAARRLGAVTERPGTSAIVPPATAASAPATATPPAPATPAASAPAPAPAAPADTAEEVADDDDPDTPTPPPTPRSATGESRAADSEIVVRTLPAASPSATPAAVASLPPVPAVPAPASQVFGGGEPSRVTVQAELDSWVQVTTTSGQQVFARMMKAGDRYVVPNRPGLRLMTGNAGGLRILVDGAATPQIGTLGAVVRDVALDPDRLVRGNATPNEPPGG